MKIGEASNQFPEFPQQRRVREKTASRSTERSLGKDKNAETEFPEAFLQESQSALSASLDKLMGEVEEQGRRLARKNNFEELNKYKDLVRNFLQKVTRELYQLQVAEEGKASPGKRAYVILKKVDLELDKLSQLVLGGQAPQLKILERLDQIRGLLLDAYK